MKKRRNPRRKGIDIVNFEYICKRRKRPNLGKIAGYCILGCPHLRQRPRRRTIRLYLGEDPDS